MSAAQPTLDDVWRLFQETDRLIKSQAAETERRFQETDRQIQQVNRQIGRLGGAWGRFVEDLVAPRL